MTDRVVQHARKGFGELRNGISSGIEPCHSVAERDPVPVLVWPMPCNIPMIPGEWGAGLNWKGSRYTRRRSGGNRMPAGTPPPFVENATSLAGGAIEKQF